MIFFSAAAERMATSMATSMPAMDTAGSWLFLLLSLVYAVAFIGGLVRLVTNWSRFADRNVGMLIVTLLVPFGGLWPLLATPDQSYAMAPYRSRAMVRYSRR